MKENVISIWNNGLTTSLNQGGFQAHRVVVGVTSLCVILASVPQAGAWTREGNIPHVSSHTLMGLKSPLVLGVRYRDMITPLKEAAKRQPSLLGGKQKNSSGFWRIREGRPLETVLWGSGGAIAGSIAGPIGTVIGASIGCVIGLIIGTVIPREQKSPTFRDEP